MKLFFVLFFCLIWCDAKEAQDEEDPTHTRNRWTPRAAWHGLSRTLDAIIARRGRSGEYSGAQKETLLEDAEKIVRDLLIAERSLRYDPAAPSTPKENPQDTLKGIQKSLNNALQQLKGFGLEPKGGSPSDDGIFDALSGLLKNGGKMEFKMDFEEGAEGELQQKLLGSLGKLGGLVGMLGESSDPSETIINTENYPKDGWEEAPNLPADQLPSDDDLDEEDDLSEANTDEDEDGYFSDPFKRESNKANKQKWRAAEKEEDKKAAEEAKRKKTEQKKKDTKPAPPGDYDYNAPDEESFVNYEKGRDLKLSAHFNKQKSDKKLRRGMSHLYYGKDSISFAWGVPWSLANNPTKKRRWDYMEDRLLYVEDFPHLRRMFEGHATSFFDPESDTKDDKVRKARKAVKQLVADVKSKRKLPTLEDEEEEEEEGENAPIHTETKETLFVRLSLPFGAFFEGHRYFVANSSTKNRSENLSNPSCNDEPPSDDTPPTCSGPPLESPVEEEEGEGENASFSPEHPKFHYVGRISGEKYSYTGECAGVVEGGGSARKAGGDSQKAPLGRTSQYFADLGVQEDFATNNAPYVSPEGNGIVTTTHVTYSGSFHRGVPHGFGTLTINADSPNGCTYNGAFQRGFLHGEGRLDCGVGNTFSGSFAWDRFGNGVLKSGACSVKGDFMRERYAVAQCRTSDGVIPLQTKILKGPHFEGYVTPRFSLQHAAPMLQFDGKVSKAAIEASERPKGVCTITYSRLRYEGECNGDNATGAGYVEVFSEVKGKKEAVISLSATFRSMGLVPGPTVGVVFHCSFSGTTTRTLQLNPLTSLLPNTDLISSKPFRAWHARGTLSCSKNLPFVEYEGTLKGGRPNGKGSMTRLWDKSEDLAGILEVIEHAVVECGGVGRMDEVYDVVLFGEFADGKPHGLVAVAARGADGKPALSGMVIRVTFLHGLASGAGVVTAESGAARWRATFVSGRPSEEAPLNDLESPAPVEIFFWYLGRMCDFVLFSYLVDEEREVSILAVLMVVTALTAYLTMYIRARGMV